MRETVLVNFGCRKKLRDEFDEAIEEANYPTRSEAIRDLMRKFVEERKEA